MPVAVPLRFVPPDYPNLVTMLVYESTSEGGPFSVIDVVTSIGSYPNYITSYTTALANAATDWFALSWEDAEGAETELTVPIKGQVTTLIADIVRRVQERVPSLSLQIIAQEVEAAIQAWSGDNTDPYDSTLTATYRQKNGLTYMAIARAMMAELLTNVGMQSATIGLVSFKNASNTTILKNITELITLAERDLGVGSLVLDMTRLCRIYGGPDWWVLRQLLYNDQELAYIPWQPWPIERP